VETLDIQLLYIVSFHVECYDIEGEVRKMNLNPLMVSDLRRERSDAEQDLRRAAEHARLVGHLRRPRRRRRHTEDEG
jgi:hypothetical protein